MMTGVGGGSLSRDRLRDRGTSVTAGGPIIIGGPTGTGPPPPGIGGANTVGGIRSTLDACWMGGTMDGCVGIGG